MDTTTTVLLCIAMAGIIYYYYRVWQSYKDEQSKLTWPRHINNCPDYWVDEGSGNCRNVFNIGNCPKSKTGILIPQGTTNFNNFLYTNEFDGNKNKCRWAKRCKASWEGIDKMCA